MASIDTHLELCGRRVRRLGFGAMRITGEGVWGEPADPSGARALLERMAELGTQLIDTADSYGPDVSERLLGEVLSPWQDDVLVATKAGLVRPAPGVWEPNGRPEHIKRQCDESLARLRIERIPLYQLHRIDPEVPVADSIGAMLELREAGKIEHIGLSEVGVDELRQVQTITPVASVQNRYSIGDREWEPVLEVCEAEGIAFLPWYPLAAGKLDDVGQALDAVAASHGSSRYTVALAWLLHRSPVMAPIPGTSSIAHLETNMQAEVLAGAITDEQWATLDGLRT